MNQMCLTWREGKEGKDQPNGEGAQHSPKGPREGERGDSPTLMRHHHMNGSFCLCLKLCLKQVNSLGVSLFHLCCHAKRGKEGEERTERERGKERGLSFPLAASRFAD